MKREIKLLLLGVILLLCLILVLIFSNHNSNPYKANQERLAESLGMKINEYPYADIFPENYFQSVLIKNSSIDEVHNLVVGYKKVYRCGGNIEIYYYFSDVDGEALRFKISYSNDLQYEVLQGEDEDSRYLDPIGCVEGRINNK